MCKSSASNYRLAAEYCLDYSCNSKVYLTFNENRLYNNLNFLKRLFNYEKYENNQNYQYLLKNKEIIDICQ
jgi:hypothetical protein